VIPSAEPAHLPNTVAEATALPWLPGVRGVTATTAAFARLEKATSGVPTQEARRDDGRRSRLLIPYRRFSHSGTGAAITSGIALRLRGPRGLLARWDAPAADAVTITTTGGRDRLGSDASMSATGDVP